MKHTAAELELEWISLVPSYIQTARMEIPTCSIGVGLQNLWFSLIHSCTASILGVYSATGDVRLYMKLSKALHGMLKSALWFYEKLREDIEAYDFKINPYNS